MKPINTKGELLKRYHLGEIWAWSIFSHPWLWLVSPWFGHT